MKARITHAVSFFGIRILIVSSMLVLLFLAYFFFYSSIDIFGYEANNPVYQYSEQLKWWLHIIVYFIIFSVFSSFAFITLSFYFVKKRDSVENIEKVYEVKFTEKLIEYIYFDLLNPSHNKNYYANFFKNSVDSKLAQEVFFTTIIRLQVLTSEDLSIKLTWLVETSGLKSGFEYFLYSYNKSEQIIAVKIISYLRLDKHKEAIAKYLNKFDKTPRKNHRIKTRLYEEAMAKYMNSKNLSLRNESTIALIRLSKAENLSKLLSNRQEISRLGINSIVNTIEKVKNDNVEIKEIINSPKTRVAAIGVLLAQSYNKTEYKECIKGLLDSEDPLLCEIAWEVFVYFANTNKDIDFMMDRYNDQTHQNKFTIINALHKFEFSDSIKEFLDYIIINEDIEMKVIAMQILFAVDFMLLLPYKNSSDKKVVNSYKEVTDLIIV